MKRILVGDCLVKLITSNLRGISLKQNSRGFPKIKGHSKQTT